VNFGEGVDTLVKTLLVGMGNPILCDDSLGIKLAKYIKNRIRSAEDVTVMEECSVGGLNFIDIAAGYERLIVLDSIMTTLNRPGYWYRFTAESLKKTMNLNNIHDANFATALDLGRRLGIPLPEDKEIHIFAVEVLDNATFSETLTEPLELNFHKYAAEIYSEIAEMLEAGSEPGCVERIEISP
jgi:hydrogenase maturation protease